MEIRLGSKSTPTHEAGKLFSKIYIHYYYDKHFFNLFFFFQASIQTIKFSPDGRYLVSAGEKNWTFMKNNNLR